MAQHYDSVLQNSASLSHESCVIQYNATLFPEFNNAVSQNKLIIIAATPCSHEWHSVVAGRSFRWESSAACT